MKFRLIGLWLLALANAQAQWVTLKPDVTIPLHGIHMRNSQEGWVVGDQGTVYYLTNKGFTWTPENNGVSSQDRLNEICFVDDTFGWIVGTLRTTSSGKVYRRTSQGTWEARTIPTSPELYAIACVRGSSDAGHLLWAVGGSRTVLHSSNSGSAFVALRSDNGSTYRDVAFFDRNLGWIVGNTGLIIRTSTGGQTWSDISPPNTTATLEGVHFANARRGWAVGSSGTIITTSDGGDSWQPQASNVTSALNAIAGIDANHLVAVGFNGTVLRTSNGGQTWVPETGLSTTFNAVAMIDTMNLWLVGANGANFFSLGKVRFKNRLTALDTLFAGETFMVDFSARFINKVDIFYRTDANAPPQFVKRDHPPQAGAFVWQAPEVNSEGFQIHIRPSDASRDTLDVSDTMVFKVFINDRDPPQISRFSLSPPSPIKGENVKISVRIADRHPVTAVLHYRQGGSRGSYTPVSMTPNLTDSTQYEASISGSELTLRGIQYYIEASDGSVFRNPNTFQSFSNPGYIEVFTNNESFHVAPSKPGPDEIYQMISIPLNLGERKSISQVLEVEGVLGQYDPAKWRLFRWAPLANNGNGAYQEYKGSQKYPALSEVTFEPGRAFWLALANVDTLNTGRGHSVAPAQAALTLIGKGWHQVANPYAYRVPADSVTTDARLTDFQEWNDTLKEHDRARFLEPYKGYFIRIEADSIVLVIPPIEASNLNKAEAKFKLDWGLKLFAKVNGVSQTLLLGQSSRASDQYDRQDWLEAPLPFEPSLRTYFPHPDWLRFAGNYREDIRAAKMEGEVWEFVVESKIEGRIQLVFTDEGSFPQAAKLMLIPKETGVLHDLRAKPYFEYHSFGNGESRRFLALAGPVKFIVAQIENLRPPEYVMFQNYPNPFNPTTAIRYGLPGSARVTLKIYNLLGEELAVLLDHVEKPAGYHIEFWNGSDARGQAVPSGVYFCRIQAGAFSMTRKMLLAK